MQFSKSNHSYFCQSMNFFTQLSFAEFRQAKRIKVNYPSELQYTTKKLNYPLIFFCGIAVIFAYIDMLLKINVSNHLVDLPDSDLIRFLRHKLPRVHYYCRYNKYRGKLYLLPLRIFSHVLRREFSCPSELSRKLLLLLCYNYIVIFVNVYSSSTFFLREDFFSHSSCIASLRVIGKFLSVLSFQHGLFNLDHTSKIGIYPGDRTEIQFVYDSYTQSAFQQINKNARLILLEPPFSHKKINYKSESSGMIMFIGDNTRETLELSLVLSLQLFLHSSKYMCFYKPHPSEALPIELSSCRFLKLYQNSDIYPVLSSSNPWIFLGSNSAALYDAYLSGFLVILLKSRNIPDTFFKLFNFPLVENFDDLLYYLRNQDHLPLCESHPFESAPFSCIPLYANDTGRT